MRRTLRLAGFALALFALRPALAQTPADPAIENGNGFLGYPSQPTRDRANSNDYLVVHPQYVLSYNPTNKAQDGTYRAIKVTVDQPSGDSDKRIALTRTGRLARKEEGAGTPRPPSVRMPVTTTPNKKP